MSTFWVQHLETDKAPVTVKVASMWQNQLDASFIKVVVEFWVSF